MRKFSSVLVAFALMSVLAFGQAKPPGSTTVYAVEKGKAYHKKNCTLKTGSKGMTLSTAKKKGYKPCKVCKPPK
jgi:competence protein ComEC